MNIRKIEIWILSAVLASSCALAWSQTTTTRQPTPAGIFAASAPPIHLDPIHNFGFPSRRICRARSICSIRTACSSKAGSKTQAPTSAADRSIPRLPENVLVFTGVTVTDHATVGFVEDTSQGTVRQVKVGDSIAQGKITDITLNELVYHASDGRTVHVAVGQNLRGESAFGLIYGTGIGTAEPSASDQNVDAGTAALLAKMRAKRLQEMGVAPATQPAQ